MLIDLTPDIIDCLMGEFPDLKISRTGTKPALRGGVCPSCSKKTLWTWLDNPGRIQCNRTNNCNWSRTSKELYPELFEKLNDKYPPTPENPTATADSYLSLIRGFDVSKIKGWYTQGKYSKFYADRETATVRFMFGAPGKQVMWERLIEDVIITDKSGDKETRNKNFKGAFGGWAWIPPSFVIDDEDTIYWVEGILDAIALNLNGYKAIAIMSSGTFPHEFIKPYLNKNIEWVIALDNDETGRRCLQKHVKRLREMGENVSAMISSEYNSKKDWNDLHKKKKLTEFNIEYYRYLGSLELAQSANEKARLIWQHRHQQNKSNQQFDIKKIHHVYTFANQTYAMSIEVDEYNKALAKALDGVSEPSKDKEGDDEDTVAFMEARDEKAKKIAFSQSADIKIIATFTIEFLYFQQPESGEDGLYFFRLKFANNAPDLQMPFQGKTFGSNADFKKAALQRAPGALYTGSNKDMDYLYKSWMKGVPKTVKTIDYVGFDIHTKTYVFSEYAVQSGVVHKLNKDSYFQLEKAGIKTTLDFKEKLSTKMNDEWIGDYRQAFGAGGLVTLTWWFGVLFAEQIRHRYRSYSFLEVVGQAASGKSDMVDFLWKLLGKSSETFNPTPSTISGYSREMSRKSNLPVVFNETDNDLIREANHGRRFDWNTIKDLYEGEIGRVTGRKTQDNTTNNPKFKGALMIVQNPPVMAEEAILTRIVHLQFDRSHHSPEGKLASNRLKELEIKQVNGFLLHAVKHERQILKKYDEAFPKHVALLRAKADIKHPRIIDNHAQIMALADCLPICLSISPDAISTIHTAIIKMAIVRQECIEEDTPLVQQFWANFEYLDTQNRITVASPVGELEKHQCNHSNKPDTEIAINLEHFHAKSREKNVEVLDSKELRRQLPNSKINKFIGSKVVHSRLENRSFRCLMFKRTQVS